MLAVPVPKAFRKKDFHGFPEQFLPRVAELRIGLGVQEHEVAFVIDNNYGIRGAVEKLLSFSQRRLKLPLLRDIFDEADHSQRSSRFVPKRLASRSDPAVFP